MFNVEEFKKTIKAAKSVGVERKHDNSGTYVCNWDLDSDGWQIEVPNSARVDGEWLYYSENVRDVIRSLNPDCIIN